MKSFLSLFTCIILAYSACATAQDEAYIGLFQAIEKPSLRKLDDAQKAKIELGKVLFNEKKLSENNSISCNSCHSLADFGVDNKPVSPGTVGQVGDRNSPTVYNAALHVAQFWDGRAQTVEEQALGPILNPKEMAMPSEEEVERRLKEDEKYVALFAAAFPNEKRPIKFENIGEAIGAFERTLITPSRFDSYLKGDKNALSDDEIAGLKKFVEVGCASCHNGALLGANTFQKLGLVKEYKTANAEDLGKANLTNQAHDRLVFKVPSLRNVEKTAPYLHDGSIKSLEDAIKIMAEYQLGKKLQHNEVHSIALFLKSLTGKLPKDI